MGLRQYGFRKIYGVASIWFSKNLWGCVNMVFEKFMGLRHYYFNTYVERTIYAGFISLGLIPN